MPAPRKPRATPAPRKPAAKRPTRGNHNKAEIFAFFGSTGSRKTTALREVYGKLDARLTLCWSPKEHADNYAKFLHCKAVRTLPEVVREVQAGRSVVFVPSLIREKDTARFELFCKVAMAVAPCCLIVEELHTVTKPNAAPESWKIANLMGRASGLRIMAASQRPASVDKEFFGGISHAWCGRQNFEDDAKTTAKLVLCKPDEIMRLGDGEARTREM